MSASKWYLHNTLPQCSCSAQGHNPLCGDRLTVTLRLAIERAKARGINKIVLASTRGDTAKLLAEKLTSTGIKMVIVPHQYGFGPGQRFTQELVKSLEKDGHIVHFGTMLFHTENLYGTTVPRIMAVLLRTFCQGMKVCVETVLMAVDGGCVVSGEMVIAESLVRHDPELNGTKNPRLQRNLAQLKRITTELQKTAMAMAIRT